MKNILILSCSLPNSGWGGGVIIRSLTKNYPEECKFFWTSFNVNQDQQKQTCNGIEVLKFKTKYFRGRGISSIILNIESKIFVANFNKLIKQNKIDLVWIVLGTSYDHLYRISKLSETISVKYHISIHDDPILEIEDKKKKKATSLFKNIVSNATTIDVISARMQAQYKKEYYLDSIVITRCIEEDFPQNNFTNDKYKTILMGGYGNASSPWPNPLIEAIKKLNNSYIFKLHLFDSKLKEHENEHIKVLDLVPEKEFNNILKTVDFGYACDDLKPENLKFAQLSLPTKIITYIGASIPFVYHGPKNSTVGDLINQYEVGVIIDNNNSEELYEAFLKLQSNYSYFQENCKLAKQKLFSQKIVQKHFYDTILNKI